MYKNGICYFVVFSPQHSGEVLVSLPLVGLMVAAYCDTQAQSCWVTEQPSCMKLKAITFYQKNTKG